MRVAAGLSPAEGGDVELHPQAIVDPSAELDPGVRVGPWTLIGPNVRLGAGTEVGPGVLIEQNTRVGAGCTIGKGAVLGTDPQDLKYRGEETFLEVGDRTVIREYATLHRGTSASGRTEVGDGCLLMAYAHVAHDCRLGNEVILANAVNMAGHVMIGDYAIVGGVTAIHQFVRIGKHAFVGGGSRVSQDVAPFSRVAGNPPKMYGLNSVGLKRRGVSQEVRSALKKAYRTVFLSGLNVSQGLERVREEAVDPGPELLDFLDFIERSERGVTV